MRARYIVFVGVVVLLAGLVLGLLAFRPGSGAGVPRLVIDTPSVDFGNIPPEKTTRPVVVRNAGTADLVVEKVTTS